MEASEVIQAARQVDSDQTIAASCVRGDQDAWEQLVARKYSSVFVRCLRFTGNREDARDATQEVFLKVVGTLHTYDPRRGTLAGWLLQVTRRVLIDRWRRKNSRPEMVASEGFFDSVPDPKQSRSGSLVLEQRDAAIVRREVERLPHGLRDTVRLRYYAGLKYAEIGGAMKVPEGTVKARLHRGHAKLATRLSPAFGPR